MQVEACSFRRRLFTPMASLIWGNIKPLQASLTKNNLSLAATRSLSGARMRAAGFPEVCDSSQAARTAPLRMRMSGFQESLHLYKNFRTYIFLKTGSVSLIRFSPSLTLLQPISFAPGIYLHLRSSSITQVSALRTTEIASQWPSHLCPCQPLTIRLTATRIIF